MKQINKQQVIGYIKQSNDDRTLEQYERIMDKYIELNPDKVINQTNINYFFNAYATCRVNVSFFKKLFKIYNIHDLTLPKVKSEPRLNITKLTYYDVKRIMYEVPLELAIYVRIYLETGIRLNELINVERKNIDVHNNTLSGIGKRRKPFQVSISQKTMGYLYQLGLLKLEFPFRVDKVKDTSKWVHYRFKKHTQLLGYPNTSIHQIRHCVAQYLRKEKKVPLEIIKEVLRHSSIVTTQRYASASKEEADQVMKELLE